MVVRVEVACAGTDIQWEAVFLLDVDDQRLVFVRLRIDVECGAGSEDAAEADHPGGARSAGATAIVTGEPVNSRSWASERLKSISDEANEVDGAS